MIRYGVAGFGLHAVHRLVGAFAEAGNARMSALARRNFAQAEIDAEKYGVTAFRTTEELCASPEVDAVFITSPNATHYADVMTAVAHGKHVICEKPMAMSPAEATEMVAAARKAGVKLGVAQSYRFTRSLDRIREVVQAGEIGEPVAIRTDFSFTGQQSKRRWLHDAELAGGGPVMDIGVHCIDTMRYILGDEPRKCSAQMAHDAESGTVECSALLSLSFARGALGSSFVSYRSPYDTFISVAGTEGSIIAEHGLDVDGVAVIEFRGKTGVRREELRNAGLFVRQVEAFANWVEGKGTYSATGEDALRNQDVLHACYRSAELGQQMAAESRTAAAAGC